MHRAMVRTAAFATSARRAAIAIGQPIPSVTVTETSSNDQVDTAKTLSGPKAVLIGVPAAFSPACSDSHVPGYLELYNEYAKKGVKNVYVTAVNDPFVMSKWKETFAQNENIKFLADVQGELSKSLDLTFDATALLGNVRSKRYAMLVEGGKVKALAVEEDPTKVDGASPPFSLLTGSLLRKIFLVRDLVRFHSCNPLPSSQDESRLSSVISSLGTFRNDKGPVANA